MAAPVKLQLDKPAITTVGPGWFRLSCNIRGTIHVHDKEIGVFHCRMCAIYTIGEG